MGTVGYHEPRDERGRALRIPEEDRDLVLGFDPVELDEDWQIEDIL
jgi:hypothetical protein